MNSKIKIIILSIFCSSLLFSSNSIEYSVGLNDKLAYLGPFSKSWITKKNNKESYIVVGGLVFIGGVGYGQKHYFSKGFFSPYFSLTGFGYYVLGIGVVGSLGVSGTLGFDMTAIKWKKNP